MLDVGYDPCRMHGGKRQDVNGDKPLPLSITMRRDLMRKKWRKTITRHCAKTIAESSAACLRRYYENIGDWGDNVRVNGRVKLIKPNSPTRWQVDVDDAPFMSCTDISEAYINSMTMRFIGGSKTEVVKL